MKKHYSYYTPELVTRVPGTPKDKLLEVYKLYGSTGKRYKAGVQNICTMFIIQPLLGNMGIASGGIAAMRGESNVQGSTDHGLLFHIWPGYLVSRFVSCFK
jgi:formate dehydrogenase major subunit